MKRSETTNTFQEGLVMDFNPLNTPSGTLSNCLNGTLITFNGDEYVLQNDMGNGRVETASLPQGYVPLGTAELGGIIYIVSYNPLIDRCQIGSFPSPERNIAKEEIKDSTTTSPVSNKNFVDENNSVTSTLVKVKLLDNMKLNPGDKFIIYGDHISDNKNSISDIGSTSHKIDSIPRYVTIRVVSIGDDGKITYLDNSLKWTQLSDSEGNSVGDYYIKQNDLKEQSIKNDIDSYNKLVSSAYNVFKSKVSGQLALLFELKTIDSFTATWSATVSNYENNESYQKQGNIFVDLNWTSQFSSLNPKAVKITKAKVTGNVGLLLKDGSILSNANDIQNYLNSLTYTFKVAKANTVIASPKSIIVNKPIININKPIKPEISQSIQEAKQEYIDQEFEAELAIKDIITLNGEYLRANDGTDKPTSVMVGKFLYNTEENPENSSTISFDVTPIMPYGDLPYLSASNTINLLDVGTGKVTISRWKYFVNDSQTFIDFGINAYPEMGCSIDKVFLKFIPLTQLGGISDTWGDEDVHNIESWNTNYEQLEIIKDCYTYTLQQQSTYSGQHNVTVFPEDIPLDSLYLVDICALYYNPNSTTNTRIYKHNFRWLFTSKQFNNFYLQSHIVDFNDIYLSETIEPELVLKSYDSVDVRTDSYFPNLTFEEMPEDNGKFSAMGVNISTINYDSSSFKDNTNFKVNINLNFKDNNLIQVDSIEYFQKQQSHWEYQILNKKLSTNLDTLVEDNIVYPNYNSSISEINNDIIIDTITDILSNGVTKGIYDDMVDQFEIVNKEKSDNQTINLCIKGVAFGKINTSIIQKYIQIEQTVRPLLLYAHEYSKFGLKERTDKHCLTGQPILKYLYGEGHRDIGKGDPFKFSFAYVDAEKGYDFSHVDEYSIGDPSYTATDADITVPIRLHSSSKNNWNPDDTFYQDNYWDDTPPYTDYLNNWMLNAGGPFQLVLLNRYNNNVKHLDIHDKTLNYQFNRSLSLWVKTNNNHYIPICCKTSDEESEEFLGKWRDKSDTFYATVSQNLAAILMQIYYVDTTPTYISRYIPNEINSIDRYKETISFDIYINVLIDPQQLYNSVRITSSNGDTVTLNNLYLQIKALSDLNIDNKNISISKDYNLNLEYTQNFNHVINIDTSNLYEYFNAKKTLTYKTKYIVPNTQFNHYLKTTSNGEIELHHGIAEGYIEPINPNKLYVIDTDIHGLEVSGFKELSASNLVLYKPDKICRYQKDGINITNNATGGTKTIIMDNYTNKSQILYFIYFNEGKIKSSKESRQIFETLIWNNEDASFDEDKLLAASERREFWYETDSTGSNTGAHYKSNSRYKFPNVTS